MPKAVIDLGTNTFHMLIVEETVDGQLKTIYKERSFVKLALGGIQCISGDAFERGLETMIHFSKVLKEYNVKDVRAIGTAALRTASNGQAFLETVKEQTEIKIELITGDEEALYIYEGVRNNVALREEVDLIMDVGGGSVELILANQERMIWAASFPVGISVLYRKFHKSDPILSHEVSALQAFLKSELEPFANIVKQYCPLRLIGATGTFELLTHFEFTQNASLPASVNQEMFKKWKDIIVQTSLEERSRIECIPDSRRDMIVVAILLIDYVLDTACADEIVVSEYALKEGVLLAK